MEPEADRAAAPPVGPEGGDRPSAPSLAAPPGGPEGGEGPGAPSLAGPSRLGRFYLLHQLGRGGMGAVYLGFDDRLDRRVALKVLHRGAVADGWLLREGKALGRLSHPNVVAVHEVGEHDGGVFLAMELVEGPTLRRWLADQPRTFAERLRLMVQAGRGLAAAHAAGLVHRDFKLDNVLVGADGRARVVDFGIAALRSDDGAPPQLAPAGAEGASLETPLTVKGALMGTPAYIAPEQFAGERATPRSDQWSYCVAFYRAVYGKPPFPLKGLRVLLQSFEQPLPPSPVLPDVPAWIAPILRRGLSCDPAARFPSVADLIAEIERHLPRDPELDPAVVVRERQLLSGLFIAASLAIGVAWLIPPLSAWLLRPLPFRLLPLLALGPIAAAVALRWRRLARNRYGRRMALVFLTVTAAITGNRLLGLALGLPPPLVLVEEEALLAVSYTLVSLLMERWLIALAALGVAASVSSVLLPGHIPTIYGLTALLCAAAMPIRLYLDRHLTTAATPGLEETSAEHSGVGSGATGRSGRAATGP